jgi:SAM-dependent methyltransferase
MAPRPRDYALTLARGLIEGPSVYTGQPSVRVLGASITPAALSPVEAKRIRAAEFSNWYYSMDLGDGVKVEAGFGGGEQRMQGHYKGRHVMHWLLQRYFGDIAGKTVLEPGCSGGFHTVELARRGAKVTAFDSDSVGLRQARLATECLASELAYAPSLHLADFYEFRSPESPFDLVYCSGLLYHLSDIPRAAKIIYESCREGAVVQTSISDLDGDVLEKADPGKYAFCVPGEVAQVPSRSIVPKIFAAAGFREIEMFDITEFGSMGDEQDVKYQPGRLPDSKGPVYLALRK